MPRSRTTASTWIVRLKKGILFAPDRGVQGQAARARRRGLSSIRSSALIDPKIRSPWAFLVEGKFVGSRRAGRSRRRRPGSSTTTARSRASRSSIGTRCASGSRTPTTTCPYVLAHEPTSARGARGRSRRTASADGRAMRNPVGTGPYKLEQWMRSSKIVLDGEPGLPRLRVGLQVRPSPADAKLVAQMKGKKMPQVGRVEISIIEEDQSRLLAFQKRRARHHELEGPLAPKVLDGGKLRPEFAAKGVQLVAHHRSGDLATCTGTCRIRVVGGLARRRSRCAARWRWRITVDEDIKVVAQRPGGRGEVSDSAGRRRPRSRTGRADDQLRPGGRQRAARQVRLQEGRRRLPHAARRQAAGRQARPRPDTAAPPARRARQEDR